MLGRDHELLVVSDREGCRLLVERMAGQARRSFHILTQDLDRGLFDTTAFIESARRVISGDPRSRIRVLVHELDGAVRGGHRLVELARRSPSHVEIRQLSRAYHHAFFVADEIGVVDRKQGDRFEATADFNDPGRARDLLEFFAGLWEKSKPTPETQHISL